MKRKTKIICTLGPAISDEKILREMILSGMNVARLNFSHGSYDEHLKNINTIKKLRKELQVPLAILLDTKGPEIRTKTFKDGFVNLVEGQDFILTSRDVIGNEKEVSVTYADLASDLKKDDIVLIDDGLIEMRVKKIVEKDVICEVKNGGKVGDKKGINLPGAAVRLPYISEKDREDIKFGVQQDVDFIAASFVRTANDVMEIRHLLESLGNSNIMIIAKIENQEGVDNIDEIIKVSDGIMVARGDMGVEISLEELPIIQKNLIQKCYMAGKPAITATQMLDSMIRNPRPTRAETTDVANAIFDGTSALMLSGETAVGKYPIETLRTMVTIAKRSEESIDYEAEFQKQMALANQQTVTNAICHATCTTAHDLGAAAIISVTQSGYSARMVSKYRPICPIFAPTIDKKVYNQLSLSWGVTPYLSELKSTTDALFEDSVDLAIDAGLVKNGDLTVITAGVPLGISGTTNIIKVHIVGHVLASGKGATPYSASGRLFVAKTQAQALKEFNDGDILVIENTTNEILPLLKRAKGIITLEGGANSHAAVVGLTLEIPVITNVEGCLDILKTGTVATLDGSRGLIYSGITKIL